MKTTSIIIIAIIFIILIGGVVAIYFIYEKPKNEKTNLISLSIFAKENNKLIKTGYKIFVDGNFYTEGETEIRGAVLETVPFNKSIKISNFNLDNQSYYKDEVIIDTSINETKRVILTLIYPCMLNVTSDEKLGDSSDMNLTIYCDGLFKNMSMCLDWSLHILVAKTTSFTEIQKIDRNNKCYSIKSLIDEEIIIPIEYYVFGDITKNDYINISFYDNEERYILRNSYTITNE